MTGYNAQVTNTDKEFKNFARAWSARDEILISWIKSKEDTIPNIPIRKLFKVLFTELEYGQCTRMVNKIHNILFWKKVKPKKNSEFVTLSLSLRNRLLLSKKKHWLKPFMGSWMKLPHLKRILCINFRKVQTSSEY